MPTKRSCVKKTERSCVRRKTSEKRKRINTENPMLKELKRLRELVDKCATHIVDFEEDTAEEVLRELGFTESEIKKHIE